MGHLNITCPIDRPKNCNPGEAMVEQSTFGEFILGLEGLAVLRSSLLDPSTVSLRAENILEIAKHREESPWSNPIVGIERSVIAGYGEWATSYDNTSSPPILAEEPVVRSLLAHYPAGKALDAACGTARHAAYLTSLGHQLTGIDATPEMLEVARSKVPSARFEVADLTSIPLPDCSMDLAVCSLSLTHCPDLVPVIRELGRVVRPGGTVVISDVHPFLVMLGAHADYQIDRSTTMFVRNHVHPISTYLTAFRKAGLNVVKCIEPLYGDKEIAAGDFGKQINDLDMDGLMEVAEKGMSQS